MLLVGHLGGIFCLKRRVNPLKTKPVMPAYMNLLLRFSAPALCAASLALSAGEIPDRPEKLPVKPLVYEPPRAADYRVALQSGPVAYVVEDRELPLVNISILVRTGDYLDPDDKVGLAGLTGYLLTAGGTKSKTAEELDERMAFLAALLRSNAGDTQGTVSLNLLSKDLDEGFATLREVLTEPRFQPDKLDLRKQQLLQSMQRRNDDSAAIEQRERRFLAYGESFWINRHPTRTSVESITRDDIAAFHRRWFHPANFIVAVNGDFARADMVARLEKLFSNWPFAGEKAPPVPASPKIAAPGAYLVNKEVNQGRVSILLPGIRRDDPDWHAIQVMNDILGGGGFTSRIMNRVRSDEGLAYSAGSGFPGGVYYEAPFVAAFQSKSRTVAYAASIVLDEMKKMASEPVTDEELNTAKKSFIETFPQTFATKGQVAGTFAQDEFTGRFTKDPDYWKNFRTKISAVTRGDVQRVATKHLQTDKVVILVVGEEKDIMQGHPDHPVSLPSLTGNRLVPVPLRDPFTMQPMREGKPAP
jgi:zinc protease